MADEEGEKKTEPKKVPTRKVKLHRVEIPKELMDDAILATDIAMDTFTIEKDVATDLKKHFDTEYGGTWHAVVGANFGSSITHYAKYLLFFQLDMAHVLLFCSDMPSKLATAKSPEDMAAEQKADKAVEAPRGQAAE